MIKKILYAITTEDLMAVSDENKIPYEPKPYARWTMKGMLDLREEVKVADEFWDFVGGQGAYNDLLNCFEQAGIELRPEIDKYFAKFRSKPRYCDGASR